MPLKCMFEDENNDFHLQGIVILVKMKTENNSHRPFVIDVTCSFLRPCFGDQAHHDLSGIMVL